MKKKVKETEELCACHPTEQNILELEKLKSEYDSGYDYITCGNIIRSKATWYEKGEKNNKYFWGLEKSRSNKNCIGKLINKQGQVVTNSKAIMAELKGFYQDLYADRDPDFNDDDAQSFVQNLNIPKLSDNLSFQCDGFLSYTGAREI